jgi:hypothetical protein
MEQFEHISWAVELPKVVVGEKNRLGPACEPQLTGCLYDFFGYLFQFQAEKFMVRSQLP